MKKSAGHSRRPGSNGQGKKGKGWRSHRRGSVPADLTAKTRTAAADYARPGTVSGPASDHRRTATTTGNEGQRTGSGPGSRRLSSCCTRAAWAVVAFATKKGGNCCPNCLLWQQLGHLQQLFTLSETCSAAPPPLQWHRLTSRPADHGPGWVGGGLQTWPPDRRRISPQLFPLLSRSFFPPRSHPRRPSSPFKGG